MRLATYWGAVQLMPIAATQVRVECLGGFIDTVTAAGFLSVLQEKAAGACFRRVFQHIENRLGFAKQAGSFQLPQSPAAPKEQRKAFSMEVRQLLTRKRVVARVLTAVCQIGAIRPTEAATIGFGRFSPETAHEASRFAGNHYRLADQVRGFIMREPFASKPGIVA